MPADQESPDNSDETIGIVIVNYASSVLIAANLLVTPQKARVVVVDNWSSASERHAVCELTSARGWTLVEMQSNRGFGAGINAGVVAATELGCTSLLLLNPDAQVAAETVEALRTACLSEKRALISPRLVDSKGQVVFAGSLLDLRNGRIRGVRSPQMLPENAPGQTLIWLTAACLAMHRDLWQRLGGFDEGFFLYWEDVDLNYRAHAIGGQVSLRSDLTAVHDQGGTQKSRRGRAKSHTYYFYNCRNRLLFAARHRGDIKLSQWVAATPTVSWDILMRGGRRQLLHSPQLLCSAVAGTLSGLVMLLADRSRLNRLRSR